MSTAKNMTAQSSLSSVTETDRVYVERNGSLEATTLSALAKMVRETIKVGGRNLLPNTAAFSGWKAKQGGMAISTDSYGMFKIRETSNNWNGVFMPMSYEEGESYALSVLVDNPGMAQLWPCYPANLTGAPRTANGTIERLAAVAVGDGLYRMAAIFHCTQSGTGAVEIERSTGEGTLRVCAPKLERGNIATDWSPAPEDLESAISGG